MCWNHCAQRVYPSQLWIPYKEYTCIGKEELFEKIYFFYGNFPKECKVENTLLSQTRHLCKITRENTIFGRRKVRSRYPNWESSRIEWWASYRTWSLTTTVSPSKHGQNQNRQENIRCGWQNRELLQAGLRTVQHTRRTKHKQSLEESTTQPAEADHHSRQKYRI